MGTRTTLFGYLIIAIAATTITYIIVSPTPVSAESSSAICMDYDSEGMSTLDADLIHTMTQGYRNNQLNYIQSKSGTIAPQDAYSIWFDLKTLKKYLYHIEKNAKKGDASIVDDSKLGIRIYYAVYPDSTVIEKNKFKDLDFLKSNPKYAGYNGLHTLIMIPTITDADGEEVDFNPLDKTTFKEGFYKNSKYSFNSPSMLPDDTAALSASPSRSMGGKNHGTLYPPGSLTGLGF